MVLGLDIKGLEFLDSINFSGFLSGLGRFVTIAILGLILAGIIGIYIYVRSQRKLYCNTLNFFEVINGQTLPVQEYQAAEYIIPGTNIRVFHIKENDFYLPRGTKPMGKNRYWYAILNNREIINFTLGDINTEVKKAGFLFDHSDMRFANENLKELINRNYRDKALKWWKEYKDTITTVIYIFVLTVSIIFILYRVGNLIGKLTPLMEVAKQISDQNLEIIKALNELKLTSGIFEG